jgi:hypothetical protein
MFKPDELEVLMKEYGKNGVRLLFLFRLLKLRVTMFLQKHHPDWRYDADFLNQLCMLKAYDLLKYGKDEPTEKDIEELLMKLKA